MFHEQSNIVLGGEGACKVQVSTVYSNSWVSAKTQSICAVQVFYEVKFQLLSTDMDVLW